MATANLALRFVVELVGVAALAYWGSQAPVAGIGRLVLMVGAPLALVVLWAAVVAPNTVNGLTQPQKDLIGTVLLLLAAGALAIAGQPAAALAFGAVVFVNWGLLVVFGDRALALAR